MKWRVRLCATAALAATGCAGPERPARADTPVKIGGAYAVRGQTYVPADDRDYDEVGLASWYGDEQGGRTANGERRDSRAIAGAHRTLPLPSYVEVTALDSGRTILVRLNDRGPFVAGRIIDLSPAAWRQLGISGGVSRVRVRRVYPPERERMMLREGRSVSPFPARESLSLTPAVPSIRRVPDGVYVQLGAFRDRSRAETLAGKAGGAIAPFGKLFRVRVGPFGGADEAGKALAKLRGDGYGDARLVRDAPAPLPEGPR